MNSEQLQQQLQALVPQIVAWRRQMHMHPEPSFKEYETMAFVNALAFVANQQDHHPDLQVSYGHCVVCWRTHDAGGVTALDLHCATLTDRLMSLSSGPD